MEIEGLCIVLGVGDTHRTDASDRPSLNFSSLDNVAPSASVLPDLSISKMVGICGNF